MKRFRYLLLLGAALGAGLLPGCDKDDTENVEVVEATRIKEITYDAAVCVGYVKGSCSERGVWYAASGDAQGATLRAGNDGVQFEVPLTNLAPGETYRVKVYAVCNGETLYSPEKSFTTLREGEPLVRFAPPKSISNTTAELEGFVMTSGGKPLLERGFCYGTADEPTLESGKTLTVAGDIGRLTATAGELTDGETYYGRVYVRNELGTFYSETAPFTTVPYNKPTATVLGIDGLGTATMTVRAKAEADNDLPILERGIRYSLTEEFDDGTDVAAAAAELGEYAVTVSGLDPEQLYNVWAYAENRKGRTYSEMLTAKALVRVTNIPTLSRSATGAFEIANLGAFDAAVTEAGLCWSTSPAPTVNDAHARYEGDTELGIGSFEGVAMWGLKPATLYYVRAYAINEYGRSYSREFTFTTREDLYDAQIRPGAGGKALPYMNGWQIILNDVTSSANANVPESTLSPAFREVYSGLEKACEGYNAYMNGVIYRLRPTTDGGIVMQFTLYYRTKASKALTYTGWNYIQLQRNADGTFRFLQYKPMTSGFYTKNTEEGKACVDVMFKYFMEHDFYFEWCSPDYEFTVGGTKEDKTSGPVRMVPVDAPQDYWTFTSKNYTSANDTKAVDNPF